MPIHVALHHRTSYRYDRLVTLGPQVVRLRPAPHARTRILSYSLRVLPEPHFLNWQQDPQSNYLARVVFPDKTREMSVEVDLVAEMAVFNPFDFFLEPEAERYPFRYATELAHELAPFQLRGEPTPRFDAYARKVTAEVMEDVKAQEARGAGVPVTHSEERPGGHPGEGFGVEPGVRASIGEGGGGVRTMDFLVQLNQRIWKDIRYVIRLEAGVQTSEETLANGSGSCRDSAWLLCQVLRHLGLASRFVSGYLIQLKADEKSLDGPSGAERDFTDLHAWCEVYLPGAGWIGLDPTSGLLAGEGHIPLAATPDPQSAAPVSGGLDPCETEFEVTMRVERRFESPRVTLPYTDDAWAAIDRLGHQVDADLQRYDCRLTMGGEPTFVSLDDREGEEWNTSALGPRKVKCAEDLMRRLKARMTRGAFLHYGQGKWYPGESLPRWAYACYWRRDGEVVWQREELLADVNRDYGYGETEAEAFVRALAVRLGCGATWVQPGYEDVWYYLWKERRLPVNVDPLKSNLREEEDRARLARVFERGLERVVGFALPLERVRMAGRAAWRSGPWYFRADRMFLIPGDSPMGLRLPLDSLPWVRKNDYPYLSPRDPLEPRGRLVRFQAMGSGVSGRELVSDSGSGEDGLPLHKGLGEVGMLGEEVPARGESATHVVRTALCVEPRGGRLYVFMPPVERLEDYLECVTAVEETAAQLGYPVVLEGYSPPSDPRLDVFKLTPDPGVLEVNLHPAENWDDTVRNTEILYEEARLARLGTEKFLVDGRHTGTGGGNHIVLGGATPGDSPFLRRPDLLRSLVNYWQNHPALSYLFSGMFLGPTSQNPRVDEARNDALGELEIAFEQVPGHGGVPPWLVDRLFRNLLVDATGNTHRAEFCIDKLYSPEEARGRQGLVELRAFEMPPHARMSLAQQLLLRTLVAWFWRRPYQRDLVRWGTEIHDRWMLPHFIWADLEEVVGDLQQAGYPMQAGWFAPHFEFRFPWFGDLEVSNLHLEVRQALEPWHVLGEEAGGGGAVRYVDSSLERVQLKMRGLVEGRHAVCVNGVRVPLQPTGARGEAVAGVRYRAWQPPNCLHPTIGVHTPLVFDVVDVWNERSLAGCTYHVMHPGGRNYTTFPVNSYEAESRRLARFFRHGHTPGRWSPKPAPVQRDHPFTLDLRRVSVGG